MNPVRLPEGGRNSRIILVWKYYKRVKMELKSICNKATALWSFSDSLSWAFLDIGIFYIFTAFKIPLLFKLKTLPLLTLLQQKTKSQPIFLILGCVTLFFFWGLTQQLPTVDSPMGVSKHGKGDCLW